MKLLGQKFLLAAGFLALVGTSFWFLRTSNSLSAVEQRPDSPLVAKASEDLFRHRQTAGRRTYSEPFEWLQVRFKMNEKVFHSIFFYRHPLDDQGLIFECAACSPELSSVTYQWKSSDWVLEKRDLDITNGGGFGPLPAQPEFKTGLLGKTPELTLFKVGGRQDFTYKTAEKFVFLSGWKYVGPIHLGADNSGSADCVEKNNCWSWSGTIRVLDDSIEPNGLPDLRVESSGTVSDAGEPPQNARSITYTYDGRVYHEKGKSVPDFLVGLNQSRPVSEPAETKARRWFSANVNASRCIPTHSPAERIKMIQEYGERPSVRDLPNGAVEVGSPRSDGREVIYTFYPSEEACVNSLPRSQQIPSRYY